MTDLIGTSLFSGLLFRLIDIGVYLLVMNVIANQPLFS